MKKQVKKIRFIQGDKILAEWDFEEIKDLVTGLSCFSGTDDLTLENYRELEEMVNKLKEIGLVEK